jgi:hypothetical protein
MENISELIEELKQLQKKLETVNETLTKITDGISDEEIGFGSRVLLTYQDGRTAEGRVWRVKKDGVVAINRDGYAAEILWNVKDLKHLSVGTYGKLEKQQWLLQNSIRNLKQDIGVQINKSVFGVKELLCKGIDYPTAKTIIKRQDFQSWYKAKKCDQSIPLTELNNASPVIICGLAREFIIVAPDAILWQAIIINHSK